MMKHGIWTAMGMAMGMGLGLSGCATETQTDRNKLEFGSNGTSLQVGDTSDIWKVSRTLIQTNGRESKENYTFFHLVSSDTTVASVIRNQQLVGRAPGEVSVKALDDKSKLETETSIKVTVTGNP
jgi:hypothetical protein